jgi:hypothetical protein
MNTLAAVVSKEMELKGLRMCSLPSWQRTLLRGWLMEIRTVSSEEPVTKTLAATAAVKNQKTSHWFMCYMLSDQKYTDTYSKL